jgi:membrane protease YdiL (CAAX protease family)
MTGAPSNHEVGDPAPQLRPRGRVRDGPFFVSTAWVVALLGGVFATAAVATAFAMTAALRGERSTDKLVESTQSVPATWVTLIASQAATLAVALVACRIIGARPRARLGLSAPGITRREAAALVVATIVPFAAGLLAASVVPSFDSDSSKSGLTRMWAEGSRLVSALWVLTIAVVPGIVEEIFYRGLVLRGFLVRWRPLAAILASSALFAVAHVDPAHVSFTFILGVWLGVIAWRTGSVVLPILMHAVVNGGWTTIQMIAARSPVSDTTGEFASAVIASAVIVAIGMAAFIWAVRILRRCDPGALSAPAWGQSRSRSVAFAGVAAAATGALLYAIIPPGEVRGVESKATPSRAPSLAALSDLATSAVYCPSDGEVVFELERGGAVRVALPANRVGVHEVITALDDDSGSVWLAYGGEVTGKGFGAGIPPTGILEQLRAGDPTAVSIRLESGPEGLVVRFALLQDQAEIDAAWARATSERWARRGRG